MRRRIRLTTGLQIPLMLTSSLLTLPLVAPQYPHSALAIQYPARIWRVWTGAKYWEVAGRFLRDAGGQVTIVVAQGKFSRLTKSSLDEEDQRYLTGVENATRPYRNWTCKDDVANNFSSPGTWASLLKVVRPGGPGSEKFAVVVRLDNGRIRSIPYSNLSPGDQKYLSDLPLTEPIPPRDGDEYRTKWQEYSPSQSPEPFHMQVGDHFVFFWGNSPAANLGSSWTDPSFRDSCYRHFESVWNFFHSIEAPLPYWNSPQKFKTCVYITDSGLSRFPRGTPSGSNFIAISSKEMREDCRAIPLAVARLAENSSGGFKNVERVNWFWNSCAEWAATSVSGQTYKTQPESPYRPENPLDSANVQGSLPFLEYFGEDPGFPASFIFDIWKESGASLSGEEDPVNAMIEARGGLGSSDAPDYSQFADIFGRIAARNATWDYVDHLALQENFSNPAVFSNRTELVPVRDHVGWFQPRLCQAPRRYGYNITDLSFPVGTKEIEANVSSLSDETLAPDFRCTLIAIDKDGEARYGAMWHEGVGRLPIRSDDRSACLVVAATPHDPDWNPELRSRPFPYVVSFRGASPKFGEPSSPVTVSGKRWRNGGGFVANTAHVDPSAFIDQNALVLDSAQVLGNSRILGEAVISGHATIEDQAIVGDHAKVCGGATVSGNSRIRDRATVLGNARVAGNARVLEFAFLTGMGTVDGDTIIRGTSTVTTIRNLLVSGCPKNEVDVSADSALPQEARPAKQAHTSPHSLPAPRSDSPTRCSAHWDFTSPRKYLVLDRQSYNDAFLRGGAIFAKDGSRSVLDLNGRGSYAVIEGNVFDSHSFTFEAAINCRTSGSRQTLFSIEGSNSSLELASCGFNNCPEITFSSAEQKWEFHSVQSLPVNSWCLLTLMVSPDKVQIFLDGKLICRSEGPVAGIDRWKPTVAYLGRSVFGSDFWNGEIYDAAVYSTIFNRFSDMSPPYQR